MLMFDIYIQFQMFFFIKHIPILRQSGVYTERTNSKPSRQLLHNGWLLSFTDLHVTKYMKRYVGCKQHNSSTTKFKHLEPQEK